MTEQDEAVRLGIDAWYATDHPGLDEDEWRSGLAHSITTALATQPPAEQDEAVRLREASLSRPDPFTEPEANKAWNAGWNAGFAHHAVLATPPPAAPVIHTAECQKAMYRGPRVCICGAARRAVPAAPALEDRLAAGVASVRATEPPPPRTKMCPDPSVHGAAAPGHFEGEGKDRVFVLHVDALDALRWLFEVVRRLDKQAQVPGPGGLVSVTAKTWRDAVTPALRQVEARITRQQEDEPRGLLPEDHSDIEVVPDERRNVWLTDEQKAQPGIPDFSKVKPKTGQQEEA